MAKKYIAAKFARYDDDVAQSLGEILENLGEDFTAEDVVKVARKKKRGLGWFEKHRRWRA